MFSLLPGDLEWSVHFKFKLLQISKWQMASTSACPKGFGLLDQPNLDVDLGEDISKRS